MSKSYAVRLAVALFIFLGGIASDVWFFWHPSQEAFAAVAFFCGLAWGSLLP